MKTLIYNKVLQAVSEVTEIAPADITSHSKTAEIVEARSLLIYYLYREELSPLQIATLSGFTRQCVEATRLRFPDKDSRSRWLANLMQHIDNILATTPQ
ncbi:MAG: hypothetical protein II214_00170 [Alistipes sp.]|nr:hypothetical protein [Alistipes sp.]